MNAEYSIDEVTGKTIRNDDKKIIANFNAQLEEIIIYKTNNGAIKKYKVNFYNPDFVASEEIEYTKLKEYDYGLLDDSLLLMPTVPRAAAEMEYYIKSQAAGVDTKTKYLFDKLGWHNINGQHCYCAGNIVIGFDTNEEFIVDKDLSERFHLEIDNSLSEKDAAIYAMKMMAVDTPATPIIFSSGVLGISRQMILDADINIPCALYVQGRTQYRKTECSKQETQLYNRSQIHSSSGVSITRVSSSEYKTEEKMDVLKDATFICDDLYRETDSTKRKIYERRVKNSLRNFADNSSRETSRSAFKNNCQLIVTAEYLIDSKTDVGRMFVIEIPKPIDSERLKEVQQNPQALSTFYYYFIKWISKNYNSIVSELKEKFMDFRETVITHASSYERLYEQAFLLRFAFNLFLVYVNGVLKSVDVDKYNDEFADFVNLYVKRQEEILNNLSAKELNITNYSYELLKLIKDGIIEVKSKSDKHPDCYKKGKSLFVRSIALSEALYKKYGKKVSKTAILKYFREEYISIEYSDNTAKKRNAGLRYMELDLDKLQADAKNGAKLNGLFYN